MIRSDSLQFDFLSWLMLIRFRVIISTSGMCERSMRVSETRKTADSCKIADEAIDCYHFCFRTAKQWHFILQTHIEKVKSCDSVQTTDYIDTYLICVMGYIRCLAISLIVWSSYHALGELMQVVPFLAHL